MFAHCARLATALLLVATPWLSNAALAELREWTDRSGKFRIEAEFLGVVDGQARLRRADGQTLAVPLTKLSAEDQQYLRDLAKQRPADQPDPDDPFAQGFEAPSEPATFDPPSPASDGWRPRTGERIEYRRGNEWLPATVVGLDEQSRRLTIRPEGTNRDRQVIFEAFFVRPAAGSSAAASSASPPQRTPAAATATLGDRSRMERIVALGDESSEFVPDPGTRPAWSPRPVALAPSPGFFAKLQSVCFAGQETGRALVITVGGAEIDDHRSWLETCDLKTGKCSPPVLGPDQVQIAAMSPDGKLVATVAQRDGLDTGPVEVWRLGDRAVESVAAWDLGGESAHSGVSWLGWADDSHVLVANDEGVSCWSVDGAQGKYLIPGARGRASVALSPGGKQLAIVGEGQIRIHDLATGRQLHALPLTNSTASANLAFHPDGARLAVVDQAEATVYELASGRPLFSTYVDGGGGPSAGVRWVDDAHFLVGGSDLVHVPSQMVVWKYRPDGALWDHYAERTWFCFADAQSGRRALLPFALPHSAVRPVQDAELAARPGDAIVLEVAVEDATQADGQSFAASTRERLQADLQRSGWRSAADGPCRLTAQTQPGESEEVEYRSFGMLRGTEKATVVHRVYELTLTRDGATLWTRRHVQRAPHFIQMQQDESLDAAIARLMQPTSANFGTGIPSRLLTPAAAAVRTSQLTAEGIR